MCWNTPLEVTPENGEQESIPRFLEMLCGFCLCYSDDSSPDFPDRVAWSGQFRDDPDEIIEIDIQAMKRLGVARNLQRSVAEELLGNVIIQNAIGEISHEWYLFDLPHDWAEMEVGSRVLSAINTIMDVHGAGLAVATKLLYLKRPKLIPICDSLIVQRLLGVKSSTPQVGMRCIECIRKIGIGNLDVLDAAIAHLQDRLPVGAAYHNLSSVRVLEAVIWFDKFGKNPPPWQYLRRQYAALFDRA